MKTVDRIVARNEAVFASLISHEERQGLPVASDEGEVGFASLTSNEGVVGFASLKLDEGEVGIHDCKSHIK